MDAGIRVRENRLRRMAGRQGLRLIKNPRRDPRAVDYGTYMLVGPDKLPVADFGWTCPGAPEGTTHLDDVETWLTSERAGQPPALPARIHIENLLQTTPLPAHLTPHNACYVVL